MIAGPRNQPTTVTKPSTKEGTNDSEEHRTCEAIRGEGLGSHGHVGEAQRGGLDERTEAERWSVGVTAHHLASVLEPISHMIKAVVAGQAPGTLTGAMIDEMNAKHAKDYAHCTKEETIQLLQKGATVAARGGPWAERRPAREEREGPDGRPADDRRAAHHRCADRADRRTLRQHPQDGWSLNGLRCAVGSWGGQPPGLVPYVTGTGLRVG